MGRRISLLRRDLLQKLPLAAVAGMAADVAIVIDEEAVVHDANPNLGPRGTQLNNELCPIKKALWRHRLACNVREISCC